MKRIINTLQRCLTKGTMSPRLREAVASAKQALEAKDLELAYQLTAVKSFITGDSIKPKELKRYSFQEDQKANERALGNSIYHILDGIHFRLAMNLEKLLPSGMTVAGLGLTLTSRRLVSQEMKHKGVHPIVRRIQWESRKTREEADRMWGRLKKDKSHNRPVAEIPG